MNRKSAITLQQCVHGTGTPSDGHIEVLRKLYPAVQSIGVIRVGHLGLQICRVVQKVLVQAELTIKRGNFWARPSKITYPPVTFT